MGIELSKCTDEIEFTGDYTIFCPMRNGCCIKECPAYLPPADAKIGNPWGSCTAKFLMGD